jgi:uncharacterized protein involved in exopolysaccharide biosynthesis
VETEVTVGGDDSYDPYFIQTTFEIIQSQLVLSNVVSTLNLNTEWGTRYARGRKLETSETVEMLRQRLELRTVRNTRFIEILFSSENPDEAAKIANAIAQSYRDWRIESVKETRQKGLEVFQNEWSQGEQDIKAAQEKAGQLRKDLNVADPEPAENELQAHYQAYADEKQKLGKLVEFHKLLAVRIQAAKVVVDAPMPLVQIIDPAVPPNSPSGPNRLLGMTLLLCGLIISVQGVLIARKY